MRKVLLTILILNIYVFHILGQVVNDQWSPRIKDFGNVEAIGNDQQGNVYVAGYFTEVDGVETTSSHLIKLNSEGVLDTTFNADINLENAPEGPPVEENDYKIKFIVPLENGKVLLGREVHHYRIWLTRLNADGSIDESFHIEPIGAEMRYLNEMLVLKNEKILLAGIGIHSDSEKADGSTEVFTDRLILLNSDGTKDASFKGKYENRNYPIGLGRDLPNIQELSNGQILVAGVFSEINDVNVRGLVKINPDGAVDEAFTNFTSGDYNNLYYDFEVTSEDLILLTGDFDSINNNSYKGSVALNPDGTIMQNINLNIYNYQQSGSFRSTSNYLKGFQDGGVSIIANDISNGKTKIFMFNKDLNLLDSIAIDHTFLSNNSLTFDKALQKFYLLTGSYSNNNGIIKSGLKRYSINGARDTQFEILLSQNISQISNFVIGRNGEVFGSKFLYQGATSYFDLMKFSVGQQQPDHMNQDQPKRVIPFKNTDLLLIQTSTNDIKIIDYSGEEKDSFDYQESIYSIISINISENDDVFITYSKPTEQGYTPYVRKLQADGSFDPDFELLLEDAIYPFNTIKINSDNIITAVFESTDTNEKYQIITYDIENKVKESKIIDPQINPYKNAKLVGDSLYLFDVELIIINDNFGLEYKIYVYDIKTGEKVNTLTLYTHESSNNDVVNNFFLTDDKKVIFNVSNSIFKYDLEGEKIDEYFELSFEGNLNQMRYHDNSIYTIGEFSFMNDVPVNNLVIVNLKNTVLKKPNLILADVQEKKNISLEWLGNNETEDGYYINWGVGESSSSRIRTVSTNTSAVAYELILTEEELKEFDSNTDEIWFNVEAFNEANISEPSNKLSVSYATVTANESKKLKTLPFFLTLVAENTLSMKLNWILKTHYLST